MQTYFINLALVSTKESNRYQAIQQKLDWLNFIIHNTQKLQIKVSASLCRI